MRARVFALAALLALTSGTAALAAPAGDVDAAVREAFGPEVVPVTGFAPYFLEGDFNGDRLADLAVVVQVKAKRSALPKGVTLLNPYGYGEADEAAGPPLAFAILHGGKDGRKGAGPGSAFLLLGGSPVLIMQYERVQSDPKGLMTLIRKGAKRPVGVDLAPPAAAKGDSIFLPTEAASGVVYWDGKTYRWYESPED